MKKIYRSLDDPDRPLLALELKKINKKKISPQSKNEKGIINIFSAITPHGLEQIYKDLSFRIINNNPMTLVQYYEGYKSLNQEPPMFQSNGQPAINGQKGGKTKSGKQIKESSIWHSYAKKREGKERQLIDLKDGDFLDNADYDNYAGYWEVSGRYEPKIEGNNYKDDIKKEILYSPLTNIQKQDLLDQLFIKNCPQKKMENTILNPLRRLITNDFMDVEEKLKKMKLIEKNLINLKTELNEDIYENLMLNIKLKYEEFTGEH